MARAKSAKGMPKALAAAIRRQHPGEAWRLDGGKPPRSPRIRVELPPEPREGLPLLRTPLVIQLPGLKLMSWNQLLSSGFRKQRRNESDANYAARKHQHSRKRRQAQQKREAQAAVDAVLDDALHAVTPPVRISIIQFDPDATTHRRDTDNLCAKALLDAIVARGVLEDDHCGIAPLVCHAIAPGPAVAVRVVVQPLLAMDHDLMRATPPST